MTTQARSIVRETVKPEYTRYTPTNGRKPDGAYFGVDGWLFALPGEMLGGVRFPQAMYAAFKAIERGALFWRGREVAGERKQVGSDSTTRKGALALAVNAVAQQREKDAAPATRHPGARARGTAWRLASEDGAHSAPRPQPQQEGGQLTVHAFAEQLADPAAPLLAEALRLLDGTALQALAAAILRTRRLAQREYAVIGRADVGTYTVWHVQSTPAEPSARDQLLDQLHRDAEDDGGGVSTVYATSATDAIEQAHREQVRTGALDPPF
jgi:hypothetical protein